MKIILTSSPTFSDEQWRADGVGVCTYIRAEQHPCFMVASTTGILTRVVQTFYTVYHADGTFFGRFLTKQEAVASACQHNLLVKHSH